MTTERADAAGRAAAGIRAPGRLAGVDLARGLALFGMLAAHLVAIDPFDWGAPSTWLDVVNGRSSILFAVLAGVSIGLSTGGVAPPTGERLRTARWRLVVRAVAIWVIGILLIATGVPVYVILPAYAILFFLATGFVQLRAVPLLLWGIGLLLVMPVVIRLLQTIPLWESTEGESLALVIGWNYPFPLWAGFLVLGLALGRADLRDRRVQLGMLCAGAAAALLGYGLGAVFDPAGVTAELPDADWRLLLSAAAHTGGLPEVIGSAGFAVAVLALCLLVCRVGWARAAVLPIRAVGSMPLTAYSAQLVVWAIWAQLALGTTFDLTGFRALEPYWPIALGLLIACTAWALTLGRGPLEWLLARLTARVR